MSLFTMVFYAVLCGVGFGLGCLLAVWAVDKIQEKLGVRSE